MFHAQSKHINIRFHLICKAIEDGYIEVVYCPTEGNATNAFTTALTCSKVEHFAGKFMPLEGVC